MSRAGRSGPNDVERYVAPSIAGTGFGVDGDTFAYLTNKVFLTDETTTSGNNVSRVIYYTPTFSGFHLSAGYTPQSGSAGTNADRSKGVVASPPSPSSLAPAYRNIYEVQGNYVGTLGGVKLQASATTRPARPRTTKPR